jgi:chemotaxis protein methyltransferase CheR
MTGTAVAYGEVEAAAHPISDGFDRLAQRDFQRLAQFIQSYSGIKMPPTKVTMVEGRLRKRVRATETRTLAEYCRYIFDNGGLEAEAIHLIDAVTTNKTEFFREPVHFRLLAEEVIPGIASSRKVSAGAPMKFWSAACSTGAEPYTLAIVLAEFHRQTPGSHSSILATDICTEVLQTALAGIYPAAMLEPVPAELRQRYVLRSKDRRRGLARIAPELRGRVQFGRLNLMDAEYGADRDMDVIFCRNILIYFDKPTQLKVLHRLCNHLRPGGYLFLGHSETLAGFDLPLRTVGNTVFRRV